MTPLHIISFGFVLGVTAVADKDAFAWVRGIHSTLNAKRLTLYHRLVWFGLTSLILTGALLVYPDRLYLFSDVLFLIKLLFVAVLMVNAILIGRLQEHAVALPYKDIATSEKRALFHSGAISVFSWLAAVALALILFE